MYQEDLAPVPPRPKNWDELFAITGGLTGVPIEVIQAGRPDHDYHFSSSDLRECGRLGCPQMHCNGVLVAISGRRFVHIGHLCASRYVTDLDNWDHRLRAMRQRTEAEARIQAVTVARDEAQKKLYWLDSDPSIDYAIRSIESFLEQAKGSIRTELESRSEKRSTQVEVHRRLSEEQRDVRRVMLAGQAPDLTGARVGAVEAVTIGELAGLNCIRVGHTPRDLKRRLEGLVWTLLKSDMSSESNHATESLQKATRNLIPLANDLAESIRDVEKFLSPSNLALLCKLDVMRRQGVQSIRRTTDEVEIIRASHWGRAAA